MPLDEIHSTDKNPSKGRSPVGRVKRVIIIVFDSLGIGALPDAVDYGDVGSHTLDNISKAVGGLNIPTLSKLGLGCIDGVGEVAEVSESIAAYGRMREASVGKDTTTGHWEIAGLILKDGYRRFPDGLPEEILREFTERTGYGYLFGGAASGTEIIERLGAEHIESGKPILYTSADSVFQIAAHEDVMPVAELYRISTLCREFLNGYNVARVIARPFVGKVGSFERTSQRRDFSIEPPVKLLPEYIKDAGLRSVAIGKISDIFCGRGFSEVLKTTSNDEVMEAVLESLNSTKGGLIFANLVDFDMLYGHRNDARGYARALEQADLELGRVIESLSYGDMLILTADHGCDPTTSSTDHSREYVPLLVYGRGLKGNVNLGTRESFRDLGTTVAEYLEVDTLKVGESFLSLII